MYLVRKGQGEKGAGEIGGGGGMKYSMRHKGRAVASRSCFMSVCPKVPWPSAIQTQNVPGLKCLLQTALSHQYGESTHHSLT